MGDKDAGEPQKSNSDARKKSKFEEEAEENVTEPFGGKTQTESENYPEEVQCKRGRRQSWKRSAGKNRSKKTGKKRTRDESGEIRGGLASDAEEIRENT